MLERSVVLNRARVLAALDGSLTEIRMLVRLSDKPLKGKQAEAGRWGVGIPTDAKNVRMCGEYLKADAPEGSETVSVRVGCPLGCAGDRLWVKERWAPADRMYQGHAVDPPRVIAYEADHKARRWTAPEESDWIPQEDLDTWNWNALPWKSSVHMPKSASRLSLDVTGVSIQRVQSMTTEQILAEGIRYPVCKTDDPGKVMPLIQLTGPEAVIDYLGPDWKTWTHESLLRAHMAGYWDSRYGKGSWMKNQWVWVAHVRKIG